ncbi:MAG: putative permease [Candidatus Magasanikbacteria bacterium GW2011_GWC2_34_16]|uniref:Putative permease n=2 Tax=Candidatus Magasanikiibacteriota TaxID=1752731 RepID=A0A0G0HDA3_9BACT|nr:MAG: putative permease [Candidatus Magasanikbacteria bacterium GW2011_GWC2_34_16]KKQ41133.1 MAG: putative permease [Candidatus Magasanikbacteria bacterium GW2011_GWA2_37_8]
MDFSKIRNYLFLGLLGIVTISFLSLLKSFAYPIFWAAIIAALFYPLYKYINTKINHPNFSTLITMLVVLLVIIIPLTVIGTLLIKQSLEVYLSFDNNQISTTLHQSLEWFKSNPYTTKLQINEAMITEKFSEITRTITSYIFVTAKNLTQDSITFFAMFLIMFYTLFFFIRDGKKLLLKLMYICPLGDKYEKMLYKKFTTTTHSTIKGTLLVAALQGTLGGLLFWITGISGAVIWGILIAVASLIPAIGTAIIWLPAGIVMLLSGGIWQGLTILIFGALVISTIDNFLRPILVGKDTQMHPLLILFSTLGGLILFGISGFMIGPIIAALFISFWEMYEEYYKDDLAHN